MNEPFVLDEPFVKSVSIIGFTLRVVRLTLGESVRIGIHLTCMNEDKSYGDYRELCIEGDEYMAWGSDDTYIVDLVKSKLSSIL